MTVAKTTVEQIAQVGIEATPGTPVAATWRPRSTLTISPKFTTGEVRPSGSYYASTVYETEESSEGDATGVPTFTEQQWYLGLALGLPTTVPEPGATGWFQHTFTMQPERPTWTVEFGDHTDASRACFVYADSYSIEFGRNSGTAKFDVKLGGGQFSDGVTLTTGSGVTQLQDVVATALGVNVYADSSLATLGTTKLANVLSVGFSLKGLRSGAQYLDSTKRSISKVVNLAPTAEFTLEVEADAPGRAWVDKLKAGTVTYLRMELVGPGAHSLTFDAPVMVQSVQPRGDDKNVYVAKYTLRVIKSTDAELQVNLVNQQA